MTLEEIKAAVEAGKKVCWSTPLYEVRKANDQWLIVCTINNNAIALTWTDGVTLNGQRMDFFTP